MLEESVLQLMRDFGSDLTLSRAGAATYDPSAGTVSNGTPTTLSARGVFIEYHQDNIDGTLVKRGDRKLLLAAEGATGTPAVDDVVSGMKVVDVRTIAPNGVPIAWTCQVRA